MTDTMELAKRGGLFGAVAYVVGYLLTLVLYSMDDNLGTEIFGGSEISSATGAGWVYYNAHLSDLTLRFRSSAESITGSINLLIDREMVFSGSEFVPSLSWGGTSLPEPLFFLVPVTVLAGAGYGLVQWTPVPSARAAAKLGGSVVAGYLPIAVLGAVLFTSGSGIEASTVLEPDLATALVFAGLLWPLLFGAIGGYLWFKLHGTASPRPTRRRPSRGR